jgi:uncharacterized peroxidase-related enzyme
MTDVEHISRKGSGVPVSWFPVPEESELPAELGGLFRKARERIGFVPNVFRAYSYRPERFSAWFAHYRQLHEPTENLDAAEREMIAVAVSMANGCLYCLVAHGAALRETLGDPILADRITLDYRRAGLDERLTAILDYAVKVTQRPLECTPEDLERLGASASRRRKSGTSSRSPACTTSPTACRWRAA